MLVPFFALPFLRVWNNDIYKRWLDCSGRTASRSDEALMEQDLVPQAQAKDEHETRTVREMKISCSLARSLNIELCRRHISPRVLLYFPLPSTPSSSTESQRHQEHGRGIAALKPHGLFDQVSEILLRWLCSLYHAPKHPSQVSTCS